MLLFFKASFSVGFLDPVCRFRLIKTVVIHICENDRLCLSIRTVVIRSRSGNLMIRCPFYDFVIH